MPRRTLCPAVSPVLALRRGACQVVGRFGLRRRLCDEYTQFRRADSLDPCPAQGGRHPLRQSHRRSAGDGRLGRLPELGGRRWPWRWRRRSDRAEHHADFFLVGRMLGLGARRPTRALLASGLECPHDNHEPVHAVDGRLAGECTGSGLIAESWAPRQVRRFHTYIPTAVASMWPGRLKLKTRFRPISPFSWAKRFSRHARPK